MTNETIYKRLCDAVKLSENAKFIETAANSGANAEYNIELSLANLLHDLKEDIVKEEAKKSGKGGLLKTAKAILKSGARSGKETLGYAYTDPNGVQWVCDGYQLLEINEPIDLPNLPEKFLPLDFKSIFEKAKMGDDKPVEFPDKNALRAYIKIRKAENKYDIESQKIIAYDFGEGMPKVNAEKFLEMLDAIPEPQGFYGGKCGSVAMIGNGVSGLLMAVRMRAGYVEHKTDLNV